MSIKYPAWMDGLPTALKWNLRQNNVTVEKFTALAKEPGMLSLRREKGVGEGAIAKITAWAHVRGLTATPEMAEAAVGIVKVTKFQAPDGTMHDTYNGAKGHMSRTKFVEWFESRFVATDFSSYGLAWAAKIILDEWSVSKKK